MNKKQELAYIGFLDEILQTQEVINAIKLTLFGCKYYNPLSIFEKISSDKLKITIMDMRNYMKERLTFNERQLYQIFEKFDWGRNGIITEQDFLLEIMPINQKPIYAKGPLTAEVESIFISLLIQIINRLRIVDVARKQISFIPSYNSFAHLDYLKKGIIGFGQLIKFFHHNDIKLTQQQQILLLHGLRRRAYKEVNLQVWCENINPLEFGYYLNYKINIQEEKQIQFLKRSRNQEEVVRRSRIQSQRIQGQLTKVERRKQAEIQRQLQLENKIQQQIINYQQVNSRLMRKALLQEDMIARRNLQSLNRNLYQNSILPQQVQTQLQYQRQLNRQQQINNHLKRLSNQKELLIQEQNRRKLYQNQIKIKKQIQRQAQIRRLHQSQKYLQENRRLIQQQQRRAGQRQMGIQRIRQMEAINQYKQINFQKQLQRTRAEIRQRKSRLNQNQNITKNNNLYPQPGTISKVNNQRNQNPNTPLQKRYQQTAAKSKIKDSNYPLKRTYYV